MHYVMQLFILCNTVHNKLVCTTMYCYCYWLLVLLYCTVLYKKGSFQRFVTKTSQYWFYN